MRKTILFTFVIALIAFASCKKKDATGDALENLNKNLVLYYPFNGDAYDASPNHINGTLKNGPVFTSDHAGKTNSALLFDGVDDFVQVDSSAILNNLVRPFTFSAWVRIDGWYITGGLWASIYNKSGTSVNEVQFHFAIDSNNMQYGFAPWSCGNFSGNFNPILNNWFNLVVVEDITEVRLYINGNLINKYPCSVQVIKNNYLLLIGSDPAGAQEYFIGAMDEFRIYNKALSSEEVKLIQ